jgi:shikimate dehydrogenase
MTARTGKALLAGVIGHPVAHSLSPALHEYWLQQYNIDGAYIPLDISPEHFDQSLQLLATIGFKGFNITLPHKERAWELVDERDEAANIIGAVNTILIKDNTFYGSNTDAFGYIQHLKSSTSTQLNETGMRHLHAFVVGAGGAARAVCVGLLQEGCRHITLCNRNKDRAIALKEDIHRFYHENETTITIINWEDKNDAAYDTVDLLVNTTQLGMTNQEALNIRLEHLPSHAIVSDIVYRPLVTPLLHCATERGLTTVDGLGMLLWQAQAGFQQWFGVAPEVTPELRAHMLSLVV